MRHSGNFQSTGTDPLALIECLEADCGAATGSQMQRHCLASAHLALLDHHVVRGALPISIGAIAVDLCLIAPLRVKEIELELHITRPFVAERSQIPVLRTALLACHHHVFAHFSGQRTALLPVGRHISDELEGIGTRFVVFDQVSRHLHR